MEPDTDINKHKDYAIAYLSCYGDFGLHVKNPTKKKMFKLPFKRNKTLHLTSNIQLDGAFFPYTIIKS